MTRGNAAECGGIGALGGALQGARLILEVIEVRELGKRAKRFVRRRHGRTPSRAGGPRHQQKDGS